MSTRKHTSPARAFRPEADGLEDRQLLSAVVSGTDSKGDTWTLRLIGPGALDVVKQPDASGKPAPLNSTTDINTITIGGTDPTSSRLVGTVKPAAGSDGRVFFQTLKQLATRSEQFSFAGLGLVSIDMPGFWLGNTTAQATGATTNPPAATISIPDGVETLRFGGVDTTFNRPAAVAGTNDVDSVQLGLPFVGGTRIIINRSVSSTQPFTTPASGTTPASTTNVQHGVQFVVSGRLDLFQADSIEGDAVHPPGQFSNIVTGATGAGGTLLLSSTPGGGITSSFFTTNQIKGSVTGAIGNVRIGGNATNFTTVVFDPTFTGTDRIANYSIGGETNNVMLVAPGGSRNVQFGKGMDTAVILSHVINDLKANRGALNSTVYADRSISRAEFGGDVVDTDVLAGYQQNFQAIIAAVTGASTNSLFAGTVSAPPVPENAQPFGGMTVHVAGDVVNSVFAASVQPFNNVFGDPNQLVLSGGHINGKVEGTINNATATPTTPKQTFFAQHVNSLSGPVIPPSVPEAPYTGPQSYGIRVPGIHNNNAKASAKTQTIVAAKTPQGPTATTKA